MSKELKTERALDNNLRPLKVGDKTAPIELATDKIRISEDSTFSKNLTIEGDLNIQGTAGDINFTDGMKLTSTGFGTGADGILSFIGQSFAILASSWVGDGDASDNDCTVALFAAANYDCKILFYNAGGIKWNIGHDGSDNDKLFFGRTTVVGESVKLTLESDGDLITVGDVTLAATKKLYLDGGGDTYISENSGDSLRFVVGGDVLMNLIELGATGNYVTFGNSSVGFGQTEPTFDATDTDVDFRTGNKQKLTLTDNCADIHFQFPTISGNFLCVLLQDGTGGRTISNWKTKDAAGNAGAGNSGLVLWAGGTAPTNTETANKADIASFYWDSDNEIAYGTYTYNF